MVFIAVEQIIAKFSGFKQQIFIISQVAVGREFGSSLAQSLLIHCSPDSSKGYSHLKAWWELGDLLAGSLGWLLGVRVSFFLSVDWRPQLLSSWPFHCGIWVFSQHGNWAERSRREQGRKHNVSYDLASEVTNHPFCHILLVSQTNLT